MVALMLFILQIINFIVQQFYFIKFMAVLFKNQETDIPRMNIFSFRHEILICEFILIRAVNSSLADNRRSPSDRFCKYSLKLMCNKIKISSKFFQRQFGRYNFLPYIGSMNCIA